MDERQETTGVEIEMEVESGIALAPSDAQFDTPDLNAKQKD